MRPSLRELWTKCCKMGRTRMSGTSKLPPSLHYGRLSGKLPQQHFRSESHGSGPRQDPPVLDVCRNKISLTGCWGGVGFWSNPHHYATELGRGSEPATWIGLLDRTFPKLLNADPWSQSARAGAFVALNPMQVIPHPRYLPDLGYAFRMAGGSLRGSDLRDLYRNSSRRLRLNWASSLPRPRR